MFRLNVLVAASLTLLLAACVATPPNPLDEATLADLHIADYRVEFADHANLTWLDWTVFQAKATQTAGGDSTGDSQLDRAGAARADERRQLEAAIAEQVRAAVETGMAGKLIGKVPATLVVRVHTVMIPSLLQRITLGGQPFMRADGILLNRATGNPLAVYKDLTAVGYAGQGLAGIAFDATFFGTNAQMKHVAQSWTTAYERWLLGPRMVN